MCGNSLNFHPGYPDTTILVNKLFLTWLVLGLLLHFLYVETCRMRYFLPSCGLFSFFVRDRISGNHLNFNPDSYEFAFKIPVYRVDLSMILPAHFDFCPTVTLISHI
jgi:hypothetical protein